MAGPIAASECSRPTAPDTCPLLGRQRELQSLESRSSAVCIIATALGSLQGPHRRRKGVPLEPPMEFLSPTAAQVLDLQPLAHPEKRMLARHRRIVDADRAVLTAADHHLAGSG
jgi:hypothetical protein